MPSPIAPLVRLGGVVVALGMSVSSAQAAFTATYQNANPALTTSVTLGSTTYSNVLTGQYNWLRTGGDTGPFMTGNNFSTFCIELTQYITNNPSPTGTSYALQELQYAPDPGINQGNPGSPSGMGTVRQNMLQQLFDTKLADVTTATKAAAFQVAIWEIVFEAGGVTPNLPLDASAGNLKVNNSTVATQANTYLAGITGTYTGSTYILRAMSSLDSQDQVVWWPNPNPGDGNPVPAPAGLVLLASGLPFAVLRLRRLRKPATT